MPTLRTKVLVVGAGTTGAMLALELAHHGVACMVVERDRHVSASLGLDLITARSMELLRRLDLVGPIGEREVDSEMPTDLEWTRSMDEPPILTVHYPSQNAWSGCAAAHVTEPVETHHRVPGSALVEVLRAHLRDHPLVDLREGWTFTGLRLAPGPVGYLLDGTSGTRHLVEAAYVAGCDGAKSTARRCVDVSLDRMGRSARHCSVYFRSTDPRLRARERTLSTVIVGGRAVLTRGDGGTWIGHFAVNADDPMTIDPAALLGDGLGLNRDAVEVVDVKQWDSALATVSAYQRAQLFLAGEAAHPFHPLSDSADISIADAVDLGWKLAAVLNGWAGPALLASYGRERRAQALLEREALTRIVEARSRFGRLSSDGATREVLAGMLSQEPDPVLGIGTHLGRCAAPHAEPANGSHPNLDWHRASGTDRSGGPATDVRLTDGTWLFDRLGPELTLIDLTGRDEGRTLVEAAVRRGIPMVRVATTDPAVGARWRYSLVLVRPDRYIAWSANAVPGNWPEVLDRISGRDTT